MPDRDGQTENDRVPKCPYGYAPVSYDTNAKVKRIAIAATNGRFAIGGLRRTVLLVNAACRRRFNSADSSAKRLVSAVTVLSPSRPATAVTDGGGASVSALRKAPSST